MVAVASFLDTRSRGGSWLLRIDDLDEPRVTKAAEKEILTSLRCHGLHWDGHPVHQKENRSHYQKALRLLTKRGITFPCTCGRKDIDRDLGCVRDCSSVKVAPRHPFSIRMVVALGDFIVHDAIQGPIRTCTEEKRKNIAIWRRDGIPSYPLSVVVDDNLMGISHVVRGSDLAANTVQQALLLDKLSMKRPHYAHVPVLNDRKGEKLSKRDKATTIDNCHAKRNVMWSMQLLGMDPPQRTTLSELLDWGIEHWSLSKIPSEASLSNVVSV